MQGSDLYVILDTPDSNLHSPGGEFLKQEGKESVATFNACVVKKNNTAFNMEEINKQRAILSSTQSSEEGAHLN